MINQPKKPANPPSLQHRHAIGDKRPPRRLRSTELFAHGDQLVIEHGEREYRLRITGNGKLILTS